MRALAFGAVLALVTACGVSAEAAHLSDIKADGKPITDRFEPLQSLQQAAKSFSDLSGQYFYWCTESPGPSVACLDVLDTGKIASINLNRSHIDVISVHPGMGMVLDIGAITGVEVYDFPTMGELYEFGVKVEAAEPGGTKAYWMRALNADTAVRLATVFRSLPGLMKGDLAAPAVTLGVSARDLSPEEAKAAGVPGGVFIGGVDAGSLAEQMAVKQGDYLVSLDGVPVNGVEDMKRRLNAGSLKAVTVWRSGKKLTLATMSKL